MNNMEEGFVVDTTKMIEAANLIRTETKKYDAEYTKLIQDINTLTKTEWKSIASDSFNTKIKAYEPTFQEMSTVLNRYADFLTSAAQDGYEAAEKWILEQIEASR